MSTKQTKLSWLEAYRGVATSSIKKKKLSEISSVAGEERQSDDEEEIVTSNKKTSDDTLLSSKKTILVELEDCKVKLADARAEMEKIEEKYQIKMADSK